MADLPIPPAPASTDNTTVILWVVGVLMLAVIVLIKWIKDYMEASKIEAKEREAKCEVRANAAYAMVEKRDAQILEITIGQQAASAASATAITNMTNAVERLTSVVENIDSGTHRVQK